MIYIIKSIFCETFEDFKAQSFNRWELQTFLTCLLNILHRFVKNLPYLPYHKPIDAEIAANGTKSSPSEIFMNGHQTKTVEAPNTSIFHWGDLLQLLDTYWTTHMKDQVDPWVGGSLGWWILSLVDPKICGF